MKHELLINFVLKVEDLGHRMAIQILANKHDPSRIIDMATDRCIELRNMVADLKRDMAAVETQEKAWKAQAGVLDMTIASMTKKERT